jgi:hypothetical protein
MGQVNLNNRTVDHICEPIWVRSIACCSSTHRPQGENKGPLTIDWFGTVLED